MPDEPQPPTDHAQTIAAIENALEVAPWPCEHGRHADPEAWFTCDRCTATTAYEAAASLIRREVAEEIAAAIGAYPGTRGPAIDDPRDARRPGLGVAQRLAREIGERHA